MELFAHLDCIFLVYFFELLVLELEEHDLEHLLLVLVAGHALAVLEVFKGRNHHLLADCLQDGLALQVVRIFYKMRHLLLL
jgi:hypothetical protein